MPVASSFALLHALNNCRNFFSFVGLGQHHLELDPFVVGLARKRPQKRPLNVTKTITTDFLFSKRINIDFIPKKRIKILFLY